MNTIMKLVSKAVVVTLLIVISTTTNYYSTTTTTTTTMVLSFTPSYQFQSFQMRQQKHHYHRHHQNIIEKSVIVRYNDNNNDNNSHEDNENDEEQKRNGWNDTLRFGRNVMGGMISGPLYATKALAVGLAGVLTTSISTGDVLPSPPSIMNDAFTVGSSGQSTTVMAASLESLENMPKSYIISMVDAETIGNLPHTLIADADASSSTTLEAPMKEVDATSEALPLATTEILPPPTTSTTSVDVQKVEDAAAAAAAEKIALEKKLAEIRSENAKKAADKVKSIDVVTTPSTPTTTGGRDKLVAEEEARIDAAKRAQLEKIYKEQEKARLSAERDAEKARKELEQRAEKTAQKAREDAEKKAIEAKMKAVKDREAATAEQAKLKYQEAEKAQAARIKAEEARRKLERENADVNAQLEFLRQVEEAKKAEAKAADDIRIKAVEERVKLDQEIRQVKGREFDETVEDIALVAVPGVIIAGVVYTTGAMKRESDLESKLIGKDAPSTPYGLRELEKQNESPPAAPFGMGNQGGFSGPYSPPKAPSVQDVSSTFNGPTAKKSPFSGGGMPSQAKAASASFGKAPFKGAADSKGPFGGGMGMPPMPTAKNVPPVPKGSMVGQSTLMPKQTVSKTKAFGNVSPAPAFPAFQTPLKGRDTSGAGNGVGSGSTGTEMTKQSPTKTKAFGNVSPAPAFPAFQTPLKGRDTAGGIGKGFGSGPTSGAFGKASPKGPALGTPPKQSFSSIPSSFEKTPQKGFVGGQNDAGILGGPGFKSGAVSPKQTPPPASKSFGMSPPKGATESKSPFGGGGGMPTKTLLAPSSFGKAPMKGAGDGSSALTPGMPPKAESTFGKAPSNGSLVSKSPFSGGAMPSKAATPSSFGNAPLKGSPDNKIPFGGGGGMPSKTGPAPMSFAKASFKKSPDSKSPFGGGIPGAGGPAVGMPPKAESKSFGNVPFKGSAENKGPFGGGGMPTKAANVSYGKKSASDSGPVKGPFGKSLSDDIGEKQSAPPFGAGSSSFGQAPSKSPFGGGGMPPKAAAPSSFGKAPLKGSPDSTGPFGGGGMPSKSVSTPSSFGKAPMTEAVDVGLASTPGISPNAASDSSFGKSPFKGSLDSKSPFGGGVMPSKAASSFGVAPLKGTLEGGSTFAPDMPSKAGSTVSPKSFAKGSFKKSPDSKGPFGGGIPGAGGPAVGMPPTPESAVSSKSIGKAPFKGSAEKKGPFSGKDFMSKEPMKGPFGKSLSENATIETKKATTSFGGAPFKGSVEKNSPFGGGMPTKATTFGKKSTQESPEISTGSLKGPFGKTLTNDSANKSSMKGPFGKGLSDEMGAKKAAGTPSFAGGPTSFGKASIGYTGMENPSAGGGGGGMPPKAAVTSFGKAPLKGPAEKSSFGGGGGMPPKGASGLFSNAPFKGSLDSKSPIGGGGDMPPKAAAPSSFGKAPLKGAAGGGGSEFSSGMSPKAAAPPSFGKAPSNSSLDSKSPFGGGGDMPPKAAAPSSFGKAPLKGATGGGGSAFSSRMPPKAAAPSSFGKAPLKGAVGGGSALSSGMPPKAETEPSAKKSFGNVSSAPLFPNKGGIVVESDPFFVARDILLDAELGRGSPEIRSDEPPPSNLPPPPKATSNRRPVFGLGGAFGKSASRQSGFGSPKSVGSMPQQGFSAVSPQNAKAPKMKQPMQPPPQVGRGPVPGAPPYESGMNQAPPQPVRRAQSQGGTGSNVNPFAGDGARPGRSMRQPMADNFTPNTNMSTNQFADGRPIRSQQPQPPNFFQPPLPPQSAGGFQQGPSGWKNQASPSPIGQFSNSVRDPQREGGTRLGSLASRRQSQPPPEIARSPLTGSIDNDQQYSGGRPVGPDDYQEVTVTDPRTGDRRTIRIPPPNPNRGGYN